MEFPSLPALPPLLSERQHDAVVVWAPAKVNLYLEVLAKRTDGYHEIASLMVAVSLYDLLEFKEEASGDIALQCDHPELSTGPDNLICRAAELLRQRTGCQRGVRIRLVKRIPLAAGLAGGSSDAAATLAGLNDLWRLGLPTAQLAAWGAELGSDVAFLFGPSAAWCTGRGEQIAPVAMPRPFWLVLACPPFGLSTAAVYRGVTVPDHPQTGVPMLQAVADGNIEKMGRQLHNRLQPVAEQLRPALKTHLARLAELRPAGQLMSGSGTSLFALCRDLGEALRVVRGLRAVPEEGMNLRVFIVRSCM
jgi:4-diphosphocytidyl-2-C-methyl-D-erythritol kinase